MLNALSSDLYNRCREFLLETRPARLATLRHLGLARYIDFMAEMPLTDANLVCVMRFFQNPSQVKFTDLRGVDLPALNLDGVNCIRGNLSGANLRGASLVKADLLYACLKGADLRDANLQGATLNKTMWDGALVTGCCLGLGSGLSEQQRQDLAQRGAIFDYLE